MFLAEPADGTARRRAALTMTGGERTADQAGPGDGGLPPARAKQAGGRAAEDGRYRFPPFGVEACPPALRPIINYALQQILMARKIEVAEPPDDTTLAPHGLDRQARRAAGPATFGL